MAIYKDRKVLRTKLCDTLEIEYPIFLAGMGTVSGPTLAAAVSNAGGLGVLGAIDLEPEELRAWIRQTKTLTDKPFGVDTIFVKQLPEKRSMEEAREDIPSDAIDFVNKMGREIGAPDTDGRPGIRVISREVIEQQFQVVLEEGVPVLVSALGNPGWLIDEAHAHGIKMLGLVGNVKEARDLVDVGVDIIIAQGHEAGGHTGRIGTLALIPQVVDAVSPVPVLAAGGIADGRGMAAALALGAAGVWCGTAFVASHEACVDHVRLGLRDQWEIDLWKERLLKATEDDTAITRVISGKTLRNIRNKFTDKWQQSEGPILKKFPLQNMLVSKVEAMVRKGQLSDYLLWSPVGQIAGMITELKNCQQIVEDMVAEAIEILAEKLRRDVDIGQ